MTKIVYSIEQPYDANGVKTLYICNDAAELEDLPKDALGSIALCANAEGKAALFVLSSAKGTRVWSPLIVWGGNKSSGVASEVPTTEPEQVVSESDTTPEPEPLRTTAETPDEAALLDALAELELTGKPQALTLGGEPLMIAYDLTAAAIKEPLKNYANAISGSFSYKDEPCSILVTQKQVVRSEACHAWLGYPEAVIYRRIGGDMGGALGAGTALTAAELPDDTFWAIGGFGLLDLYDPAGQGFTGSYADVLRKTGHTWLGVKRKVLFLGYCADMTAAQVNEYVKGLGVEAAVMLDGGSVAAINSAGAQINTETRQSYLVQAIP